MPTIRRRAPIIRGGQAGPTIGQAIGPSMVDAGGGLISRFKERRQQRKSELDKLRQKEIEQAEDIEAINASIEWNREALDRYQELSDVSSQSRDYTGFSDRYERLSSELDNRYMSNMSPRQQEKFLSNTRISRGQMSGRAIRDEAQGKLRVTTENLDRDSRRLWEGIEIGDVSARFDMMNNAIDTYKELGIIDPSIKFKEGLMDHIDNLADDPNNAIVANRLISDSSVRDMYRDDKERLSNVQATISDSVDKLETKAKASIIASTSNSMSALARLAENGEPREKADLLASRLATSEPEEKELKDFVNRLWEPQVNPQNSPEAKAKNRLNTDAYKDDLDLIEDQITSLVDINSPKDRRKKALEIWGTFNATMNSTLTPEGKIDADMSLREGNIRIWLMEHIDGAQRVRQKELRLIPKAVAVIDDADSRRGEFSNTNLSPAQIAEFSSEFSKAILDKSFENQETFDVMNSQSEATNFVEQTKRLVLDRITGIDGYGQSLSDATQTVKPSMSDSQLRQVVNGLTDRGYSLEEIPRLLEENKGFDGAKIQEQIDRMDFSPPVLDQLDAAIEEMSLETESRMGDNLAAFIEEEEGRRNDVYMDTEGNLTVGIGHKLTKDELSQFSEGDTITDQEVDALFREDMNRAKNSAERVVTGFEELPVDVQNVLVAMAFQMGEAGLSGFKNVVSALEERPLTQSSLEKAAEEMLDSRWALQTPDRAKRAAELVRNAI